MRSPAPAVRESPAARRPLVARLAADARGATIVEFAIVLPVMLAAIMGMMDLCYQIYVQAMLTGAVQRAGRDATIQANLGNTAAIDAKVLAFVQTVAAKAAFVTPPTRQSFSSFSQINSTGPEPFVDTNKNGTRDAGECFDDVNGNGVWDNRTTADTGGTTTTGANDVIVYTVTITYPRLFPLYSFLGIANTAQLSSSTLLRNQPFASQTNQEQTICS